jgi:hypothetical protein
MATLRGLFSGVATWGVLYVLLGAAAAVLRTAGVRIPSVVGVPIGLAVLVVAYFRGRSARRSMLADLGLLAQPGQQPPEPPTLLSPAEVVEDPGWWRAVPGAAGGTGGSRDLLLGIRSVFLSYCVTLVGVGVVTAVIQSTDSLSGGPGWSPGPVTVAVGLAGVLCLVAIRVVERPLDPSTDATLAGGYRTRFFLRLAFAEVPALLGFVAFLVSSQAWMYLIGGAFSLIGLWRAAPTARSLRRDQQVLAASGSQRSLVAVLRGRVGPY